MNRRKFLQTGTAAVLSTIAVPGCLSSTDAAGGVGSGGSPDVPVEITTSDGFDKKASHESADVTAEETEDGEDYLTVTYVITPETDECVDVTAHVKLYDNEDVVLDEGENREQYDPGDTYRMKHTITNTADELGKIEIHLSTNSLSAACHV